MNSVPELDDVLQEQVIINNIIIFGYQTLRRTSCNVEVMISKAMCCRQFVKLCVHCGDWILPYGAFVYQHLTTSLIFNLELSKLHL